MTLAPLDLRRAFGTFPTGVAVVAAAVDGLPQALVVSSFTSVSLDPPLVSFCVTSGSHTWGLLRTAPVLGVSILGQRHRAQARQLAGAPERRFDGVAYDEGADGRVHLAGAGAHLTGRLEATYAGGDHAIVVLRLVDLAVAAEHDPLVFHGGDFGRIAVEWREDYLTLP